MPSPSQQSVLHPVYLRLLGALLTRRGVDVDALMHAAGLPHAEAAPLPYASIKRLILLAIEATQCLWLGLEFGTAAQIHTHGLVGNAAIASGSLDAALRTVARFAGLRTRLVCFHIERGSSTSVVRIQQPFDLGDAAGFVVDAIVVIVERMLLALSTEPFQIARYTLPFPRPLWADRYGDYLNGEIFFDGAGDARMEFDNRTLDRRCLTADAQSYAQAADECARSLEQTLAAPNMADRIRGLLLASEPLLPTAEQMAQQLHLSPRSLFRQLKATGLSYRDFLDQHRLQRADWLLVHTHLSVEHIAERLGYADTSNFSRTFRRWTGATPSAYRNDRKNAGHHPQAATRAEDESAG